MNKFLLASLLFIAVVASSVATYIAVIGIHGEVNVVGNTIHLNLEITEPSGSITYTNITTIEIRDNNTRIIVNPKLLRQNGNFSLSLSGALLLKSIENGETYRIQMPCLTVINEKCARPLMIIPGYDVPMKIEPGKYVATLILTWEARGRGSFDLNLYIEKIRENTNNLLQEVTN